MGGIYAIDGSGRKVLSCRNVHGENVTKVIRSHKGRIMLFDSKGKRHWLPLREVLNMEKGPNGEINIDNLLIARKGNAFADEGDDNQQSATISRDQGQDTDSEFSSFSDLTRYDLDDIIMRAKVGNRGMKRASSFMRNVRIVMSALLATLVMTSVMVSVTALLAVHFGHLRIVEGKVYGQEKILSNILSALPRENIMEHARRIVNSVGSSIYMYNTNRDERPSSAFDEDRGGYGVF